MTAYAYTLCPEPCPACGSEETSLRLEGSRATLECEACPSATERAITCAECFRLDECPEPGEPCSSYIPTP